MLYLLLVYTIPVSEFLDVVPNSDVSKSVTSRRDDGERVVNGGMTRMGNRSAYSGIQSSIIFYLGGLGEKTDHRKYLMRVWGR